MNQNTIELSLAAPAFNEGSNIQSIIESWINFLKTQPYITKFEIVICNDGSQDNTKEVLESLAKKFPEVRPLHFKTNQGAAAALAYAITATQYEWVLLLDSDGQFPIENLTAMWTNIQAQHAQAALGIRQKQDHIYARLGSKLSSVICNLVHGSKIKDFNSAFKLIDGKLLRSLSLEAKGMNYSTEITSRLLEKKAVIVEVDINHCQRKMGKSNIRFIRDTTHRFLFVCYIAMRQLLLKLNVIKNSHQEM